MNPIPATAARERVIAIVNKMLMLLEINDDENTQSYINYLQYRLEELKNVNENRIYEIIEKLKLPSKSDWATIGIYKDGVLLRDMNEQYEKLERELYEECFRAIVISRGGEYE